MSDTDIQYEVNDHVGVLTINRPQARNALTLAMYAEIKSLCLAVTNETDIKALIIKGAGGKAFAAGTDMTEFRQFSTSEDAWHYEEHMEKVLDALENVPVPTIAALHGACTGGGGAIAAGCDIRLASNALKFGFPIARTLGNCLSANNLSRLVDIMGTARVKEMLFTARLLGADETLAIGLVSEVLDDEEILLSRAHELAHQLSQHAPLTMRATKIALHRIRKNKPIDDKDLITLCYMSRDFKHGMEAFLGKQKPQWQGK